MAGTLKMTAIAAMASNRVIGNAGAIPWHISEDFKFFKATTMGGVLLMGRKTYESIGRPLPGRTTVVLSRTMPAGTPSDALVVIRDLKDLPAIARERKIFLAGGAELYRQLLPFCEDLYLTEVDLQPEGDALFPPFEDLFVCDKILVSGKNFTIRHFNHR
ncbi:MAG: dihydrofolate reductase [Opitutales bacterium]|nr:dihydrofolate reductase [Opitutales bacterium]